MLNPLTQLWNSLDDMQAFDLPEFTEGDLIEFDSIEAGVVGAGVIKCFTKYNGRDAVVIVPASSDNPSSPEWLDYAYVTDIDPMTLTRYVEVYEDTYGQLSTVSEMHLRKRVVSVMQTYSPIYRNSYVSAV